MIKRKTSILIFLFLALAACTPSSIQSTVTTAYSPTGFPLPTYTPDHRPTRNIPSINTPNNAQCNCPKTPGPTLRAYWTLQAQWTQLPTATFSIPTAQSGQSFHPLATISAAEVANRSEREIILLLFAKYFEFRKSDQVDQHVRILNGEARDLEYYETGHFNACIIMTPFNNKEIFFDMYGYEMSDGRIKSCQRYKITLKGNMYIFEANLEV